MVVESNLRPNRRVEVLPDRTIAEAGRQQGDSHKGSVTTGLALISEHSVRRFVPFDRVCQINPTLAYVGIVVAQAISFRRDVSYAHAMPESHVVLAGSWADSHIFSAATAFADARTSALTLKQAVQSGWYLLRFLDDTFYVGESVDLRARMGGQDRKWGEEIATVRFRVEAASKQELKRREKILTRELETLGVPLRNVLNASIEAGRDALDELLPAAEQNRWLRDPRGYNAADQTPMKSMAAQEIRYSTSARRYHDKPEEAAVTAVLRTFLEACVPAPRATEFQYWSVSTGTYNGRRRLCVSVGKMEVLVVNENLSGFLNVRRSLVAPDRRSERELRRRHPDTTLHHAVYDDAGTDLVLLSSPTLDGLQRLLDDPQVTAAAARLVFDVMQKHFCKYTRYHCPQVVQSVYPGYPRAMHEQSGIEVGHAVTEVVPAPFYAEADDAPANTPEGEVAAHNDEEAGDVICFWIVTAGPQKSGRNQTRDFLARGEWRMDPDPRFESKVAAMLPGERIAVQNRRNVASDDIPFDRRGNLVSAMDFHLTGTISSNPGDGCSVRVAWDAATVVPRRYYLYTSQDTVWVMARGLRATWDDLIGFVFDGKPQQNIDALRNAPRWSGRFGDR
ncbi:GIY-YIG nuclease family protein [Nocardia sp. NPDC051030]|uniref:GIY-YIG nuclease family protein n=1 Tax=Nocardia sp. NPDC051030 TaxID=3155162 RepID=UPI00341BF85E